MVMPSNQSNPWVHYWAGHRPGSVGHLYSPGGQRGPYPWLPFALDNGAFSGFDAGRWLALMRWACLSGHRPLWVAVPDCVGDAKRTTAMWEGYAPKAAAFGWPLAFVVQDGHLDSDVPGSAAVVFVGGSIEWKRKKINYWCERFPRVHVGRINTYEWGRYCYDAGAESIDGTGMNRGDKKQTAGIMKLLREMHGAGASYQRGMDIDRLNSFAAQMYRV